MIGPGTGCRAIPRHSLHDRRATGGARQRTGCFFGHQRSHCDFFYSDELNAMKTSGLLTRLSPGVVARTADKKFYVQDRMREVGPRSCGNWLAEGANVYVCGDAKRMAKDVEARAGRHRRPVRARRDRPTRPLASSRNSKRRAGSSRTCTETRSISLQIRTNKISHAACRGRILDSPGRPSEHPHRYFRGLPCIRPRTAFHYSGCCVGERPCARYRRKPACIYTRDRFPRRTSAGIACGGTFTAPLPVIAAVVFGTLSYHPF